MFNINYAIFFILGLSMGWFFGYDSGLTLALSAW